MCVLTSIHTLYVSVCIHFFRYTVCICVYSLLYIHCMYLCVFISLDTLYVCYLYLFISIDTLYVSLCIHFRRIRTAILSHTIKIDRYIFGKSLVEVHVTHVRQRRNGLYPAALSQMSARQISNSVSHVCDTVIKTTHSTQQPAPLTRWQLVLCVIDTCMSQICQIWHIFIYFFKITNKIKQINCVICDTDLPFFSVNIQLFFYSVLENPT